MSCIAKWCSIAVPAVCMAVGLSGEASPEHPRISVIGDSYSGYSKAEYPLSVSGGQYSGAGWCGIYHYDWMYWLRFANAIEGSIECVDGYPGAWVAKIEGRSAGVPFISPGRLGHMGSPDIVVILGGLNDQYMGVPLGDYKYADFEDADLYSFRPAYAYLVNYFKTNMPNAEIYAMVNPLSPTHGQLGGRMNEDFCSSIETIAAHYGVHFVRCEEAPHDSVAYHPNFDGQKVLGESLIEEYRRTRHPANEKVDFSEIAVASDDVFCLDLGEGRCAFVFPRSEQYLIPRRGLNVERLLLVGGGGAGGWATGNGGNGGEVREIAAAEVSSGVLARSARVEVVVGGGGRNPYEAETGSNSVVAAEGTARLAGGNGGETSVTVGGVRFAAAGGVGGASATGDPKDGTGAGGGSAAVENDITGVAEAYGAGGGRGTGIAFEEPGMGGAHAGRGALFTANAFGLDGRDGYGAGGGGGSRNGVITAGGNGGCGCAVLVVSLRPGEGPGDIVVSESEDVPANLDTRF